MNRNYDAVVKAVFLEWLINNQTKNSNIDNIISYIDNASKQLLDRKIILESLWKITNPSIFAAIYKKAQYDKLFRVMDKKTYCAFIKNGQIYLKFLKSKPNFQFYADKHDYSTQSEKPSSSMTIKEAIIYVLSDAGSSMAADKIYSKIIEHNLYTFGAQNPINVVCNVLNSSCDNSSYSSKYKSAIPCFHYEKDENGKRVYSLLELAPLETTRNYALAKSSAIVPQGNNCVNIYKAEEYLLSQGLTGATVQEIISVVQPSASIRSSRKALDKSVNIITMPQNMYVHANAFVDLDEAEDVLAKIFKTHFTDFGGYSNSTLLYGAAALDMSLFLNDNDCDNTDSVFAIARYLFEKKAVAGKPYKFASPHIFESEPDFPLSLKGLMINLARRNRGVLGAEEAKDYLQKTMLSYGSIGQLLQIALDNTFLMYDNAHYILSEKIGIDQAWTDTIHDKLDNLFRQANVAYVIPRDINSAWFDTLPVLPMGMRWTMLILQEVLQKYPAIGFKPVKSELGQSYSTIAAAIVPKGSQIQTFPDVVTLHMQERHQLPIKMACEELRIELRDAGMLEGNELIYSLHKALDDYRFAWTNDNKTVLVRGN